MRVNQKSNEMLELDGVENTGYFVLCDADVGFCNLNTGVFEDFVQQQKTICAMVIGVIYIATESFAERMSRKMVNVQSVSVLNVF